MRVMIPERTLAQDTNLSIPSKRRKIVLTHGHDSRPKGRTNDNYINWMKNKYDRLSMPFPYHYILTRGGSTIQTLPHSVQGGRGYLSGYHNDIIIFVERDPIRDKDPSTRKNIVNLIAEIVMMEKLSADSVIYVRPTDIDRSNDPNVLNFLDGIKEEAREVLEESDKEYVFIHSLIGDEDNVPIRSKDYLTNREIADYIGVSKDIVDLQNGGSEPDKPFKLQLFTNTTGIVSAPNTFSNSSRNAAASAHAKSNRVSSYILERDSMAAKPVNGPQPAPKNPGDGYRFPFDEEYQEVPFPFDELEGYEGRPAYEPTPPVDNNEVIDPGVMNNRRPFNPDEIKSLKLPGYDNAYFEFRNIKTGETRSIGFMISPNSVSHSMSSMRTFNRTMGGWFISRNGQQPQTISLTGYMLDAENVQERHNFIEEYYNKYVVDKKNANNEIYNDWETALVIEGKRYIGYIESFNPTKASTQPFMYQYALTFTSLEEQLIYRNGSSQPYTYHDVSDPTYAPDTRIFVGPTMANMLRV